MSTIVVFHGSQTTTAHTAVVCLAAGHRQSQLHKIAYLDDLKSILDRGWLHPGSIVVADNVRVRGSPKYRAYMREQRGKLWNTVERKAHVEYQSLVSDLVLESDYQG